MSGPRRKLCHLQGKHSNQSNSESIIMAKAKKPGKGKKLTWVCPLFSTVSRWETRSDRDVGLNVQSYYVKVRFSSVSVSNLPV